MVFIVYDDGINFSKIYQYPKGPNWPTDIKTLGIRVLIIDTLIGIIFMTATTYLKKPPLLK